MVVKLLKHLKGYKAVLLRRWRRRDRSTKTFEAMHQLQWYLIDIGFQNLCVWHTYSEWVVVSGAWSDLEEIRENHAFRPEDLNMFHQETMEVWEPNQAITCEANNPSKADVIFFLSIAEQEIHVSPPQTSRLNNADW